MKISLDLTAEQIALLTSENAEYQGEVQPPLEDYAVTRINGLLDAEVQKGQRNQVVKAAAVLTSVKLDAEDLATVLAIAAKHPTK